MNAEAPSPDALFVALVLAPHTYSRNKYFTLFQNPRAHQARRRAQIVRSILRDLTEPWPHPGSDRPGPEATIVEQRETDGVVRLVYKVDEFDYVRTAHLTQLEAAALRYALSRVGRVPLSSEDKSRVEAALAEFDPLAPLEPDSVAEFAPVDLDRGEPDDV